MGFMLERYFLHFFRGGHLKIQRMFKAAINHQYPHLEYGAGPLRCAVMPSAPSFWLEYASTFGYILPSISNSNVINIYTQSQMTFW